MMVSDEIGHTEGGVTTDDTMKVGIKLLLYLDSIRYI